MIWTPSPGAARIEIPNTGRLHGETQNPLGELRPSILIRRRDMVEESRKLLE